MFNFSSQPFNFIIWFFFFSKSWSFRNPKLFLLGFFPLVFKTNQINNRKARAYPYLTMLSKDGGCFLDGFLLLLFITVSAGPCALQTWRFYGSTLPNYSPLSRRLMQGDLGEKCVQREGVQSFLFHLLFRLKMRGKVMNSLCFFF